MIKKLIGLSYHPSPHFPSSPTVFACFNFLLFLPSPPHTHFFPLTLSYRSPLPSMHFPLSPTQHTHTHPPILSHSQRSTHSPTSPLLSLPTSPHTNTPFPSLPPRPPVACHVGPCTLPPPLPLFTSTLMTILRKRVCGRGKGGKARESKR